MITKKWRAEHNVLWCDEYMAGNKRWSHIVASFTIPAICQLVATVMNVHEAEKGALEAKEDGR